MEAEMVNLTDDVNRSYSEYWLDRCGRGMDDDFLTVWEAWKWWCEGALFTIIGIIGLLANLLSLVILSKKDVRKHSFNQLLIALAVFDIIFIVVSIPVFAFEIFNIFVGNKIFAYLYAHVLYPLSPVTLNSSTYMTIAITIERYLAVCHPIRYRNFARTTSDARRVTMYVAPVVAASFLLNIPKFFETQVNGPDKNFTVSASELRMNLTYMYYYSISYVIHPTLSTGIIPTIALMYMNVSIFIAIRRNNAMRNQRRKNKEALMGLGAGNVNNNQAAISGQASSQQPSNNRQSDTNLAVVLIGIVFMHLTCHSLRIFLASISLYFLADTLDCMREIGRFIPPLWILCAETVSSLMVMINNSGNFLIYCAILKPFKDAISSSCDTSYCLRFIRLFRRHDSEQQIMHEAIIEHDPDRPATRLKETPKTGRVVRILNRRRKRAAENNLQLHNRTDNLELVDEVIVMETRSSPTHSNIMPATEHHSI